jgi:hypothetical protein
MPQTYEIKDPRDGSIFELQSDHPPTPDEARTAVAKYRVTAAKASGQPTMGASINIADRTMPADALDAPPDAVTLGQFVDNPRESMQKIGQIIKQDLTDPKLWAQAALMYFGPKAIAVARPVIAGVQSLATPGMVKDLATVGLGDSRVGAGLRIGSRVAEAVRNGATSPAESVSGGTPPPAGPPPESVPAGTKSPQAMLNDEAIARRRAAYQAKQAQAKADAPPAAEPKAIEIPPEVEQEYLRLRKMGKTDQQAKDAILNSLQMNAKLGLKIPTEAETKFPKGMRGRSAPDEP